MWHTLAWETESGKSHRAGWRKVVRGQCSCSSVSAGAKCSIFLRCRYQTLTNSSLFFLTLSCKTAAPFTDNKTIFKDKWHREGIVPAMLKSGRKFHQIPPTDFSWCLNGYNNTWTPFASREAGKENSQLSGTCSGIGKRKG